MRLLEYSDSIGLTEHKRGEPMGLKQLRQRAGLTQVKLAKLTGIAQTTLSGYETGRYDVHSMTLDNALRLSRALGCRPDELTDGYPE